MTQAKFDIKGLQPLLKKMNNLEPKVQKKVVRKALREGSKVIQQEAKNTVPQDTGDLKKSVKVRSAKRKKNRIGVIITTDEKDKAFSGEQFYGAFVEFGTRYQPPQHWMENAFNAKAEGARDKMLDQLKKGIEEEAKKP